MPVEANDQVVLVLGKGDEADATLEVLRSDHPEMEIEDRGPYWHIRTRGEILIDLDRVSEELGERIELSEWLVVMSTFVGRVDTGPSTFRVTSEMADLEKVAQKTSGRDQT